MEIPDRVLVRVAQATVDVQPNGCHYSRYSLGSHGYPQVGWFSTRADRGMTTVARALWAAKRGPIPAGLTVEHAVCKDRMCVNLDHLELWTLEDNGRDGAMRRHHGRRVSI